ncbi:zf-HC2 domain-containing protein [Haemophilus haemolyticus]|uniref:zf-HC2 domain-containing protein n=1 Tax=Haemophilus haemolyticus TaxID=726 RepID=UPI000E57336C|nr:zf-HC2 domain-containing protein [Haemophilus haemolyticus]
MRCRQVTRMISESHERSLDTQEKVGLKVHLVMCSRCRRFKQNCETLSMMMKKFKDLH